jgi:hypothetical protein
VIQNRAVRLKKIDLSEKYPASTFKVEEQAKQETSNGLHSFISQKTKLFIPTAVRILSTYMYECIYMVILNYCRGSRGL